MENRKTLKMKKEVKDFLAVCRILRIAGLLALGSFTLCFLIGGFAMGEKAIISGEIFKVAFEASLILDGLLIIVATFCEIGMEMIKWYYTHNIEFHLPEISVKGKIITVKENGVEIR